MAVGGCIDAVLCPTVRHRSSAYLHRTVYLPMHPSVRTRPISRPQDSIRPSIYVETKTPTSTHAPVLQPRHATPMRMPIAHPNDVPSPNPTNHHLSVASGRV